VFVFATMVTGQTIDAPHRKIPPLRRQAIRPVRPDFNPPSPLPECSHLHDRSSKGVDTKTLTGKVMCGYQGWFGAPGDGHSQPEWRHWTNIPVRSRMAMRRWISGPDVFFSELDASQRIPTGFKMADGSPAQVFSSFGKPTVLKHFQWMQDYGIDGVFVQRFANGLKDPAS